MPADKLTVLDWLPDRVAAELVAGQLRTAGIPAELDFDDVGGAYPALQNIRGVAVLVPSSDLDRARDVRAQAQSELPIDEGDSDPDSVLAAQRELDASRGIDHSGRWAIRLFLFALGAIAVVALAERCA